MDKINKIYACVRLNKNSSDEKLPQNCSEEEGVEMFEILEPFLLGKLIVTSFIYRRHTHHIDEVQD